MSTKPRSRSLLVFYVLVGYVLAQLLWWGYHIHSLDQEIHQNRLEILELRDDINNKKKDEAILYEKKLIEKRFWMVLGEGGVFVLLLILGIIQTKKSNNIGLSFKV